MEMDSNTDCSMPISNFGNLTRPDGSTIYSQGKSTVIAGVYGPIDVKPQKMLIDRGSVETFFRPKSGLPGVGDRLYETIIRNICETALVSTLYPRSGIQVVIQEMQSGGELISCSVNAACLALLDSGIDMKFLIAAATCCLDQEGYLIVDPTELQQEKAKATFVFVFESSEGRIVASHTTGTFKLEQYEQALDLCKKGSAKIFEYYRKVINGKYNKK
ncbi:PREDICTED: exosome complex component RRP46 [Nicrophorus vespilloides]|uniref:Exosome complex component RRP46 n=1 Tax=Nicrophorus vespilloides TaxID=110193 RepID=A0ABM1NEI0_NICVS|nr:PREDICTED: exosome complex component RRP46 [Nicrophorus vespilloides]